MQSQVAYCSLVLYVKSYSQKVCLYNFLTCIVTMSVSELFQ